MTRLVPLTVLVAVPLLWVLNLRQAAGWYFVAEGVASLRTATQVANGGAAGSTTTEPTASTTAAAVVADDVAAARRALEQAVRLAPANPYSDLFLGVAAVVIGDVDETRRRFAAFTATHPGDVGVPLRAWSTYRGTPDCDPYRDVTVDGLELSPHAALMAAWFAYHRTDVPTARNFLLHARSAAKISADYHYLLGLACLDEGKVGEACEQVRQARALAISRIRLKTFGSDLDACSVTVRTDGDGAKVVRGPWLGHCITFGQRVARR